MLLPLPLHFPGHVQGGTHVQGFHEGQVSFSPSVPGAKDAAFGPS